MNKDGFLTIRLPKEFKEALRLIAEQEERSLASQVLVFIKEGLKNAKAA
jgi:hypothetical protein